MIPALITHSFDLDLSNSAIHYYSKNLIIPLAILSVMSAMSFTQLKIVGLKPVILFISGSFIIATLPPILFKLIEIIRPESYGDLVSSELWKGLVPIVGSWIGGSTSQLLLKEIVGCSEELFMAILVLDNFLVNIWTIAMFQMIKHSNKINKWFHLPTKKPLLSDFINANTKIHSTWITIFFIILISATFFIMNITFLSKVVILSIIGLCLGNVIKTWDYQIVLKLGGLLILVIMATLGLKLNFNALEIPANLIIISIVWLILHYVGMIIVAYYLKIHAAWIPIASMANLGGISTAPAVTSAYEKRWMPHAIVLSILSMISGTGWGLFTIYLFRFIH